MLSFDELRQNIIRSNLAVKALINDITNFIGSSEELNRLNETGRFHLSQLRSSILELETYGKEQVDDNKRHEILKEVNSYKEQLSSTLSAFREANVQCILKIEKRNTEELFALSSNPKQQQLKQRKTSDKSGLLKQSGDVTNQMLRVSRQLTDTTKQSADTLDVLLRSSSNITSVHEELKMTGTYIDTSEKILSKYQTRDLTDRILIVTAFIFFFFCVFYVIYCRI